MKLKSIKTKETMLTERLFFVTQEGRRNLETSILIILINSRTLTYEDCSVSECERIRVTI